MMNHVHMLNTNAEVPDAKRIASFEFEHHAREYASVQASKYYTYVFLFAVLHDGSMYTYKGEKED